ncbi:septum formation initiator family protein [Lachnospiraceae bacterium MD1]|uniref:Septum formation initiator family protein n=1 Tax=Variimorphobacter saccharofermentans TaxID=2755051 RepID=A0A839JZA4_9FIRM|nr:septum formation initiator family protein [Variimorphobacter saccharofermentans]MBB2182706.1 septum formation initiator family protein [Variimorphobacter saccharofermentans]
MDTKRRPYQYNAGTSYVEGNTVRKLNAAPNIHREQPLSVPSPHRQIKRQPVSSGMTLASLLVLTIAIIATVYVCVDYLKLQYNVNQMEKSIITLEREVTEMTKVNDAAYEDINETYDLEYIYEVAVNDLGMVYPNNNTVITYEPSEDGYVRQFEDIPK